jgi:hypothetical protein
MTFSALDNSALQTTCNNIISAQSLGLEEIQIAELQGTENVTTVPSVLRKGTGSDSSHWTLSVSCPLERIESCLNISRKRFDRAA